MIAITAGEAAKAVNGELLAGSPETVLTGVTTDSRRIQPGDLFIALPGERFDGHDFAAKAAAWGAAGVVVSRPLTLFQDDKVVILVPDTVEALQNLARYHRGLVRIPVIGVTGSIGKTTTKDMIAAVLEEKGRTLKTSGNYNNEIGLPLTLLDLAPDHQAAVIEMGMRGLGEIDFLCRIAVPTLGVITNIDLVHIERLGSLENIARAKGELLDFLGAGGTAVLNGDDPQLRRLGANFHGRVIYYGLNDDADVTADCISLEPDSSRFTVRVKGGLAASGQQSGLAALEIILPVPGRHNVLNALAAVAVGAALALDADMIRRGLERLELTRMRLEAVRGYRNSFLLNDTYNASPASMMAALEVLIGRKGNGAAIAVLGNMLELGDWAVSAHNRVGRAVAELGVDYLIVVGDLAVHIARGAAEAGMDRSRIWECGSNQMAVDLVKEIVNPGDSILIKGSRGMKMEEITAVLKDDRR
jgi:UDP-N-acetylmuramoyl-tripeptide--D-alanyl-D-alanine ligase